MLRNQVHLEYLYRKDKCVFMKVIVLIYFTYLDSHKIAAWKENTAGSVPAYHAGRALRNLRTVTLQPD